MIDRAEYLKLWNDLDKSLRKIDGMTSDLRNKMMADWLEQMILEAKEAYYTTSNPIMTDKVYDNIEDDLRYLRPFSEVLRKVGYEIK